MIVIKISMVVIIRVVIEIRRRRRRVIRVTRRQNRITCQKPYHRPGSSKMQISPREANELEIPTYPVEGVSRRCSKPSMRRADLRGLHVIQEIVSDLRGFFQEIFQEILICFP